MTDPAEVQARLMQLMKIEDEGIVEFDDPVPTATAKPANADQTPQR